MPEALAGYYTYQPPGSGLVIHLSLDAMDGILGEVMTGFGAIPRRGAEVGGLLLGRQAEETVWIEKFAMVACEHRRGPSYLLSDRDEELFSETVQRHQDRPEYPVGYFRSNTRDSNALTDEDRALFGKHFPPPSGIFLLVRPYASKTSTGTFLIYKDGGLDESSANLFPFQRWELEGGAPPRRRPLGETKPRRDDAPRGDEPTQASRAALAQTQTAPIVYPDPTPAVHGADREEAPWVADDAVSEPEQRTEPASNARRRPRAWVRVLISLVLFLAGAGLGFEAAWTYYPRQAPPDATTFALGLAVRIKDENLHIQWNREAPAIRTSPGGRLEIRDGQYTKTVELDSAALRTGSVIYPPLSPAINLRLQLRIKDTSVVTETLDWARSQTQGAVTPPTP